MNKFLITCAVIILLVFLQFAVKDNENKIPDYHFEDTYKEINFKNVKDKKTAKIFSGALISLYYSDYSNEKLKEQDLLPEYMKAAEIDLDDDGVNEIIGTVNLLFNEPEILGFGGSTFFGTPRESDLYILQKQNEKYVDIADGCILFGSHKIEILEDKINNYQKIKYYSLGKGFPRCDAPIIPRVAGYENGEFCYRYDL